MKKCPCCGREYPDSITECAIDHTPLAPAAAQIVPKPLESAAIRKTPASRPVKPALMTRLRALHLYLGCIFAPMLLLFAVTGIWQTLDIPKTKWMSILSAIHTSHNMKNGAVLISPLLKGFIILMSLAFIATTILGILMAVNVGRNRRAAYCCLAGGIACPLLLILIRAL